MVTELFSDLGHYYRVLLVALDFLGCPGCVLRLPVRAGAAEGRWALDLRVSMQKPAIRHEASGRLCEASGDTLAFALHQKKEAITCCWRRTRRHLLRSVKKWSNKRDSARSRLARAPHSSICGEATSRRLLPLSCT